MKDEQNLMKVLGIHDQILRKIVLGFICIRLMQSLVLSCMCLSECGRVRVSKSFYVRVLGSEADLVINEKSKNGEDLCHTAQ